VFPPRDLREDNAVFIEEDEFEDEGTALYQQWGTTQGYAVDRLAMEAVVVDFPICL
jgi:hypothetical protein